jgi:predicted nucleotidyltransferase
MLNLQKSKLRSDLLAYYFNHPGTVKYIRELAREIKADPTNLQREFSRLLDQGIFICEKKGNLKYFSLNDNYLFLKELKSVVSKTIGIESSLRKEIKKLSEIEFAFIYGSYARGEDKLESDIDLFIIGNIGADWIFDIINKIEKETAREINFRIFEQNNFEKNIKEKNSFILNIIKNKKIFLKGDEKDFRKICKGK